MRVKEAMTINQEVLDKIRVEERRHPFNEFGGWLIVKKGGFVEDVVFDMEFQSGGAVDFGVAIIRLTPKQRKLVRGWFHKHPVTGLSYTDKSTVAELTEFWGECYTMVLQSDGKMLLIKTVYKESTKETENTENTENNNAKKPQPAVITNENQGVRGIELQPRYNWLRRRYAKNKNKQLVEDVGGKATHTKDTKKNTFYQKCTYGQEVWKNTETEFEKEIPFGLTRFTPEFTNNVKRFKLWHPKLKSISKELTFFELMSNEQFILNNFNKSYKVDKTQVINLLRLNNLKILMCSGAIDVNKRVLYEGDKVKFVTPFSYEEQEGTISLSEGKWVVCDKKFLHTEEQGLDENISIKFMSDIVGEGS